jgi:hypothetical protein
MQSAINAPAASISQRSRRASARRIRVRRFGGATTAVGEGAPATDAPLPGVVPATGVDVDDAPALAADRGRLELL